MFSITCTSLAAIAFFFEKDDFRDCRDLRDFFDRLSFFCDPFGSIWEGTYFICIDDIDPCADTLVLCFWSPRICGELAPVFTCGSGGFRSWFEGYLARSSGIT